MKRNGFTLIETLAVAAVIGLLFTITIPTFSGLSAQLKLNATAKSIASTLRTLQSNAILQHKTLSFDVNKTSLPPGIIPKKTSKIIFSSSGATPPGGSGTLIMQNRFGRQKKIIVSSSGRVRIE